jgi:hypothetical protein
VRTKSSRSSLIIVQYLSAVSLSLKATALVKFREVSLMACRNTRHQKTSICWFASLYLDLRIFFAYDNGCIQIFRIFDLDEY